MRRFQVGYRYGDRKDVAELAYIFGRKPEGITRADVKGYNRWLRAVMYGEPRRQAPLARVRGRARARRCRRVTLRRASARSPGRRSDEPSDDPHDVAEGRRA
jgi:hypothetical protein